MEGKRQAHIFYESRSAAARASALATCRDGGPGIAPGLMDRLFVPFDQLGVGNDPAGGSGLGLALVRGLVEAMSGSVGVSSTPGRGTTVTVRLPAAVDAATTTSGVRSGGG